MSQNVGKNTNFQQVSRSFKHQSGARVSIHGLPDEGDAWDTAAGSLEAFDADLKRLYQVPVETIEYISCGGALEDDPVLLTPDIVTQKRRAQRKKLLRLQQAHGVFKLDADLAASMEVRALFCGLCS